MVRSDISRICTVRRNKVKGIILFIPGENELDLFDNSTDGYLVEIIDQDILYYVAQLTYMPRVSYSSKVYHGFTG